MPAVETYSPRRAGTIRSTAYDYDNTSRPTSLPRQAQAGRVIRVQAERPQLRQRPPLGLFKATPARDISADERAIGGVKSVALNEQSISALVTAEASSVPSIQDVITTTEDEFSDAETTSASAPADTSTSTSKTRKFRSFKVVLDNVAITNAGAAGGYFYKVYLNLPENADIDTVGPKHFLGTLRAFEIAGEAHHGSVTLEYPAAGAMVKMLERPTREL
jgi:tyrosinase